MLTIDLDRAAELREFSVSRAKKWWTLKPMVEPEERTCRSRLPIRPDLARRLRPQRLRLCILISRTVFRLCRQRFQERRPNRAAAAQTNFREHSRVGFSLFISCTPVMRASSVSKCATRAASDRLHPEYRTPDARARTIPAPVISLCTNLDELDKIRCRLCAQIITANSGEWISQHNLRVSYADPICDFARWQSRLQKINPAFRQMGFWDGVAPLATACMQPNDSVHHETIRLVSLNFRLRRRIASWFASIQIYHTNAFDFANCRSCQP